RGGGCRRQIRQARQVGDGCLRRSNGPRAEAGSPPGATSRSPSFRLPAPERLVLRVERLVRPRNQKPIVTSQRSKQLPNHLLVTESSLSTQGIGGSCGRQDAYGSPCPDGTLTGNPARRNSFIPPSRPVQLGAASTSACRTCRHSAASARGCS